MILQAKQGTAYVPHPEGIHPAVCVDVIDLGLQKRVWQGTERVVRMLRLVFETEELVPDGRHATIYKRFTASIHAKSNLGKFLGKWRGKDVAPGEIVDLGKLIGASCTLVISHVTRDDGFLYAQIDAVSKPTKKLKPSGDYDGAAMRERIAEWAAKNGAAQPAPAAPARVTAPVTAKVSAAPPKPAAPTIVQEVAEDDVPF